MLFSQTIFFCILDLYKLLQVKQLLNSVYHLQMDDLVERFNKTLKRMLRQVVAEDGNNWDLMLSYVFVSENCPRPPQDLLLLNCCLVDNQWSSWTEEHQSPHRTVVEHVWAMRERTE